MMFIIHHHVVYLRGLDLGELATLNRRHISPSSRSASIMIAFWLSGSQMEHFIALHTRL